MKRDITINLPAEYFDILSEVFHIGIQRVKTDTKTRQELKAWWDAEKEIIGSNQDPEQ